MPFSPTLFLLFLAAFWLHCSAASDNGTSLGTLTVGFALSVDHAVATIRHSNVAFEDLVRVGGSDEYVKLMQRFSSWSSQHPSPPYTSLGEMWNDMPRQLRRCARKKIGRPASSDVAVIATLLKDIANIVEETIESPISALISFPSLPGLYQEDIADAATYVGLRGLANGLAVHPHELVAAYAGHGYGLCKSYNPVNRCKPDDGQKSTAHNLLLVEYTKTALLLHLEGLEKAVELSWPNPYLQLSFDLGSSRSPNEFDIRDLVLQFLYHHYNERLKHGPPNPITVILSGDAYSFSDGKVQRATKTVLEAIRSRADIWAENPEYVAARGAAEMVWRALNEYERMEL